MCSIVARNDLVYDEVGGLCLKELLVAKVDLSVPREEDVPSPILPVPPQLLPQSLLQLLLRGAPWVEGLGQVGQAAAGVRLRVLQRPLHPIVEKVVCRELIRADHFLEKHVRPIFPFELLLQAAKNRLLST